MKQIYLAVMERLKTESPELSDFLCKKKRIGYSASALNLRELLSGIFVMFC
ncbi:MAG: hypothetical protein LBO74_10500 [Candidatus Symbiothrix sp.]|jgi:hypothetical protein|nr:hypothetical protein [Candidatus Symbiothrix sp.]